MSWASKQHHYSKDYSDITEANAEYDALKAQYREDLSVDGAMYSTSSAKGKEGRLVYIGSDEKLDLDGWNKSK